MIDGYLPGTERITLAGDKGYDTRGFVENCRERNVTPHVAKNKDLAAARRWTRDDETYWLLSQPGDPEAYRGGTAPTSGPRTRRDRTASRDRAARTRVSPGCSAIC
jgi:hypothetical protein